jgi:hypothetical protein
MALNVSPRPNEHDRLAVLLVLVAMLAREPDEQSDRSIAGTPAQIAQPAEDVPEAVAILPRTEGSPITEHAVRKCPTTVLMQTADQASRAGLKEPQSCRQARISSGR